MTSMDAWKAFERKDYAQAGQIWLRLIDATGEKATQLQYWLDYTYVLLAQRRFSEARTLLQDLYASTGSPVFLHQLGCVACEAGELDWAKTFFLAEISKLDPEAHNALAANSYELGRVALMRQALTEAWSYAESSLKQALAAGDSISEGTAHRLMGDVLMGRHDAARARRHYRAARQAYADGTARQAGSGEDGN
ncbi:MAG: tetratricopeptide repeat protein [Candidatus Sericytochromatia bacterium]